MSGVERRVYSPSEVAVMTGVSRGMIYRGLKLKIIPSVRFGKRYVIPKGQFDRWFEGGGSQRLEQEAAK